jgi:hypothetical protein
MTVRTKRNARGFTLVEVAAASVILCGAVVTVGAVATQALTGTRLNRQYEMAASVIDKQFGIIDYVGIDSIVEAGDVSGDSEDLEYSFHWEIETEYQEIDNLYLVTGTVTWLAGKRPYSFIVETMFDGTSSVGEAETE